jgi:ribonuclease-3
MIFEELERTLGYKFKNQKLLEEAMTHPSTSFCRRKKNKFNYERLEFLGDSILSFVIVEYLFGRHPEETEGELSRRKAMLVSKAVLSNISKELNLGKFLILSSGEENNDGRKNVNNLENALEALIGAMFLDSNVENVKKFIVDMWKNIDENEKSAPISPKTRLQNWTQKHYKKLPEYKIVTSNTNGAEPYFEVLLTVPNHEIMVESARSIREAEEKLAINMLKKLKIICTGS